MHRFSVRRYCLLIEQTDSILKTCDSLHLLLIFWYFLISFDFMVGHRIDLQFKCMAFPNPIESNHEYDHDYDIFQNAIHCLHFVTNKLQSFPTDN